MCRVLMQQVGGEGIRACNQRSLLCEENETTAYAVCQQATSASVYMAATRAYNPPSHVTRCTAGQSFASLCLIPCCRTNPTAIGHAKASWLSFLAPCLQVSLGAVRWVGLEGATGLLPLARIGPVALGAGPVEQSHLYAPEIRVYLDPLQSLMWQQAVLRVHAESPEVALVQCDNFSWFGYPEDTLPHSARNFVPGLSAGPEQSNVLQIADSSGDVHGGRVQTSAPSYQDAAPAGQAGPPRASMVAAALRAADAAGTAANQASMQQQPQGALSSAHWISEEGAAAGSKSVEPVVHGRAMQTSAQVQQSQVSREAQPQQAGAGMQPGEKAAEGVAGSSTAAAAARVSKRSKRKQQAAAVATSAAPAQEEEEEHAQQQAGVCSQQEVRDASIAKAHTPAHAIAEAGPESGAQRQCEGQHLQDNLSQPSVGAQRKTGRQASGADAMDNVDRAAAGNPAAQQPSNVQQPTGPGNVAGAEANTEAQQGMQGSLAADAGSSVAPAAVLPGAGLADGPSIAGQQVAAELQAQGATDTQLSTPGSAAPTEQDDEQDIVSMQKNALFVGKQMSDVGLHGNDHATEGGQAPAHAHGENVTAAEASADPASHANMGPAGLDGAAGEMPSEAPSAAAAAGGADSTAAGRDGASASPGAGVAAPAAEEPSQAATIATSSSNVNGTVSNDASKGSAGSGRGGRPPLASLTLIHSGHVNAPGYDSSHAGDADMAHADIQGHASGMARSVAHALSIEQAVAVLQQAADSVALHIAQRWHVADWLMQPMMQTVTHGSLPGRDAPMQEKHQPGQQQQLHSQVHNYSGHAIHDGNHRAAYGGALLASSTGTSAGAGTGSMHGGAGGGGGGVSMTEQIDDEELPSQPPVALGNVSASNGIVSASCV